MPSRHRLSFTLLELVFVIVLTLMVLVVLTPELAPWRKAGHSHNRVNCNANLKQIGTALMMYSGDHEGAFPLTPPGNSFEPLNTLDYLADSKVYGCPYATPLATTAADSNYRYVGSGVKDDDPNPVTTRLAYDRSGNHPHNKWMNALFVDGHTEGAEPDGSKTWNAHP